MKTATDVSTLQKAGWSREHGQELTPEMRAFLGAASAEGDLLLYDLVRRFCRQFPALNGVPMDGTTAGKLIGRWIVETC